MGVSPPVTRSEVSKQPPSSRDAAKAAAEVVENRDSEGGGPVPLQAIARAWREVAEAFKTRWIRHSKIPTGKPEKAVRARWREAPDLQLWRIAMECAAREDFWAGRTPTGKCPDGWRATIESFARDKHFNRFLALAREDWRVSGDDEMAFEAWVREMEADPGARQSCGYPGAWPDDEVMNPATFEDSWESLRAWWFGRKKQREA